MRNVLYYILINICFQVILYWQLLLAQIFIQARHRVAIIIPFRDRQSHLTRLLDFLIPVLQRQRLDFRFIVTEQVRLPLSLVFTNIFLRIFFLEYLRHISVSAFSQRLHLLQFLLIAIQIGEALILILRKKWGLNYIYLPHSFQIH